MASDDLQLVADCKTPLVGLPTVNNLLFFPLIVCLRQTSPISSRSRLDSISCRPGLGHIATLQKKKSTSPRAPLGPNFFTESALVRHIFAYGLHKFLEFKKKLHMKPTKNAGKTQVCMHTEAGNMAYKRPQNGQKYAVRRPRLYAVKSHTEAKTFWTRKGEST